MNKALGLIETIGLISAIEAADAAVKAANIVLLGYENTKGSGKITIKFAGDVGAVKAGVAAGLAAAARVGQVYGSAVIPRPHDEIDALIRNLDRGRGLDEPAEAAPQPPDPAPSQPAGPPQETAVVDPDVAPPDEPASAAPAPGVQPELLPAPDSPVGGQAPDPEEEAQPEVSQCAATTRSGEPCRLPAQPGSPYCFVHRKLAADE